jgi:hypothetical protein
MDLLNKKRGIVATPQTSLNPGDEVTQKFRDEITGIR